MSLPAMTADRATIPHSGGGGQPLHGAWLFIARIAWVVLTLGILALNIAMAPRFLALLQTPCQPGPYCFYLQPNTIDQQFFHQSGLTLGFMATYQAVMNLVVVLIYCAIAAVIFWRRSTDRMALFCAFTLLLFGGAAFTSTLQDTLAVRSALGFWVYGILYTLGQTGLIAFFFLFPNGRFVPRWSLWIVLAVGIFWTYNYFSSHVYNLFFDWTTPLSFVAVLTPVAAQIYRYRHVSTPTERQQTKWVVFGFAICMVGFVLVLSLGNLLLPPELLESSALSMLAQTVFDLLLLLVPISIAVAILRSRLYDIDILINRTLVYGSLTAILAGVYVVGVVGVQAIVNTVARNPSGQTSPVLVVITTLLIAALFQPLRRRLQRAIDRRFYRRKYDVTQTLATFSATLRQEVDLSDLNDHLLTVVQQTMEPASLSLWLRSPTGRS